MVAQVFLDVVESVNLLVNSNGTVVRSEVVGALKMRTYLSGMPECKLGLNDKVRRAVPLSALEALLAYMTPSKLVGVLRRFHPVCSTEGRCTTNH